MQRLPLPVFPLPHFASRPHVSRSYKGVSDTVFHAVPYLCQDVKRDFIPGSLGPDVLGNDVDPTAIDVLDDMGKVPLFFVVTVLIEQMSRLYITRHR
jgi:hypothetical protein